MNAAYAAVHMCCVCVCVVYWFCYPFFVHRALPQQIPIIMAIHTHDMVIDWMRVERAKWPGQAKRRASILNYMLYACWCAKTTPTTGYASRSPNRLSVQYIRFNVPENDYSHAVYACSSSASLVCCFAS